MSNFDEFWQVYPRRVAKRAAKKAWDKEIASGTPPQLILSGLFRQLPYLESRPMEFRPHPATWINQGRFEDDIQQIGSPAKRTIADAARDFLTSNDYRGDAFGIPSIGRH